MVLESFGNLISNTSKFIVPIVHWFTSLLYSLHVENRVIICSVSMVLGLGILVDAPYLAGFVVTLGGSDILLSVSIIHVPTGDKVGNSVLGLSILYGFSFP